jgi:hypothetical protein
MTSCNSYIKTNKLNLSDTKQNLPNTRKFSVQDLTSIKQDEDYINFDIEQSEATADHIFATNNNNKKKESHKTALENPTQNWRDGIGTDNNNINSDTKIRYGKVKYERKHQKQLFQRPFLTIPYIGRGELYVDKESYLLSGESTGSSKQCNALAGKFLENQFTPLVPNLKDNIQNTNNLIPEDNQIDWIRGGISTRNIVKDIDYFNRCNDDNDIKKALVNKKQMYKKK